MAFGDWAGSVLGDAGEQIRLFSRDALSVFRTGILEDLREDYGLSDVPNLSDTADELFNRNQDGRVNTNNQQPQSLSFQNLVVIGVLIFVASKIA